MDTVEQFSAEGKTAKIVHDEFPESPRSWDNLGTMHCEHRRYNLGDEKQVSTDDCRSWDEVEAKLRRRADARVVLPLYLYDHSGLTISTSPFYDPWDSGQLGLIYASGEDIRRCFGVKRITARLLDTVREALEAEVRIYDSYLRNEVYGLVVEDAAGNEIDESYGYFSLEEARDEAKALVGCA